MYEYESIVNHKKYYSSTEYSALTSPYDEFLIPLFYSKEGLKSVPEEEYQKALIKFANECIKIEQSGQKFSSLEIMLSYINTIKK